MASDDIILTAAFKFPTCIFVAAAEIILPDSGNLPYLTNFLHIPYSGGMSQITNGDFSKRARPIFFKICMRTRCRGKLLYRELEVKIGRGFFKNREKSLAKHSVESYAPSIGFVCTHRFDGAERLVVDDN